MELKLRQLTLINFKGVRNLTIDFGETTSIDGENGTGKTTIFDAYLWLLFNKDSSDKKDFNIKTLDKNNRVIPKLDHEVIGEFDVDGTTCTLRKVYREKWVKKKGFDTPEFTGNETEYYYNGVPMAMKEYQVKIDNLINESIAKLITNPLYFNSLKWQDKREILTKIVGEITDQDIFKTDAKFDELVSQLNAGKTLKEYKAQVVSQRKKVSDDLQMIPTRIDEAQRTMPEIPQYDVIEQLINDKQKELDSIDLLIEDKSKAQQQQFDLIQVEQSKLNDLKTKLQQLKFNAQQSENDGKVELKKAIQTTEQDIASCDRDIEHLTSDISKQNNRINTLTETNNNLIAKYNEENTKSFQMDESKQCCPTCKRDFPADEIHDIKEQLERNFNDNKLKIVNDIKQQGSQNKLDIEVAKKSVEQLTGKRDEILQKKSALQQTLLENKEELQKFVPKVNEEIKQQIDSLEAKINTFVIPTAQGVDVGEYKLQRNNLIGEITQLNNKLAVRDQVDKINARIQELEQQEKTLAQELSNLEKMEFLITDFERRKIEEIEQRVNSMFTIVQFKMFEKQINGGENPICECLVNGVPYNDVNTAGRINAGIDIINTLTNYYSVYVPIFIDNRESVNTLIPCKSQIVNLVVSKNALTVTKN